MLIRNSLMVITLSAASDIDISNYFNEKPNDYQSVSLRYGENPHQKAKFYNDGSNRLWYVIIAQSSLIITF